jgi:hypothetical protein
LTKFNYQRIVIHYSDYKLFFNFQIKLNAELG